MQTEAGRLRRSLTARRHNRGGADRLNPGGSEQEVLLSEGRKINPAAHASGLVRGYYGAEGLTGGLLLPPPPPARAATIPAIPPPAAIPTMMMV